MRTVLLSVLVAATAAAADGYQQVIDDNKRPMLGVEMTPVPTHVLDREGLSPGQGVLVNGVFGDSAAANMGVSKGDIILGVNGQPVGSMTDLRNEVGLSQTGDPVAVTVLRDGRTLELQSHLRPWPANIPYTPLDPAAEKRFREWQERRQDRLAQDAQRLREQISDLNRRMDDSDPPGPGQAGIPDAGPLGLPAFRLSLRVPADPSRGPFAGELDAPEAGTAPDPTGRGSAWIAHVRVSAAR